MSRALQLVCGRENRLRYSREKAIRNLVPRSLRLQCNRQSLASCATPELGQRRDTEVHLIFLAISYAVTRGFEPTIKRALIVSDLLRHCLNYYLNCYCECENNTSCEQYDSNSSISINFLRDIFIHTTFRRTVVIFFPLFAVGEK